MASAAAEPPSVPYHVVTFYQHTNQNRSMNETVIEEVVHDDDWSLLLPKLKAECYLYSLEDPVEDGRTMCPRVWDGLLCWPPTPANFTRHLSCPGYVPDFDIASFASRHCTGNGTWYFNAQQNQTWTNYSACGSSTDFDSGIFINATLMEHWVPVIKRISQIGYGVSLGTLLVSLCILASCKRLYCPRNTLHMHLFISFIMRAFMALLKDNLFVDGLVDFAAPTEVSVGGESEFDVNELSGTWECRVVTSFWQYFILANYSWILMEGLYLHNLIFMALFTDSSAITLYIILGWGLPLFFSVLWIILRALLENHLCWTTNANVYIFWACIRAPISASVLVNLFFFLHIAWVLLSKLRSSVSAETRKYRYRKWAKSTLVLMPLFGVHYTVYTIMHGAEMSEAVEVALLFIDQLFTSFQGFLVALLYCLLNGEVRGEVARRWKRFRQNHNLESPWSQYSTANNSRTNTTRWRTSFHSVQVTSVGERVRGDTRVRSVTPPLVACYSNNAQTTPDAARSSSNPGSLHQTGTCNSNLAQSSYRNSCSNRLEKIVSENEDSSEQMDIIMQPNESHNGNQHDEDISLAELPPISKPVGHKSVSKTSL